MGFFSVLDRQLMNDRHLEYRAVAKTLLPIQGTLFYIMPIASNVRPFLKRKVCNTYLFHNDCIYMDISILIPVFILFRIWCLHAQVEIWKFISLNSVG